MLSFGLGVLTIAAIYGVAAVSLNLQAGVGGLLNFGQVAFFGIGAYASGIASELGAHWAVGILCGMVVAAAAGAAVGRLGRSLAADYWAISTLALAELFRLVVLNQDALTGGPQGIGSIPGLFGGLGGPTQDLLALGIVVVILAFCYFIAEYLTKVQFGRVVRLIRERPMLAASLGHDVVSFKVRMLVISAPMAALAGSLFTHYISYVGPDQLLPLETFLVFTMIVVGGMGNHKGAVLGAFVVQALFSGTRFIGDLLYLPPENAASIRVLVIGAALLGFLLFRTGGLVPEPLRRVDAGR